MLVFGVGGEGGGANNSNEQGNLNPALVQKMKQPSWFFCKLYKKM